mmetsp:Transcript_8102/g.27508  ORF Transcript_8102/g.27508 Transcript_8102/m.27508 type:complete len:350 (-) Transcript_8102:786-1835(-)
MAPVMRLSERSRLTSESEKGLVGLNGPEMRLPARRHTRRLPKARAMLSPIPSRSFSARESTSRLELLSSVGKVPVRPHRSHTRRRRPPLPMSAEGMVPAEKGLSLTTTSCRELNEASSPMASPTSPVRPTSRSSSVSRLGSCPTSAERSMSIPGFSDRDKDVGVAPAISVGKAPVSWLLARLRMRSVAKSPSSVGTLPANLLESTRSWVSAASLPTSVGRVPERLLPSRVRRVAVVAEPISVGRVPVRKLLYASMKRRLEPSAPRWVLMLPLKLLLCKVRRLTPVSPSSLGISPVSWLFSTAKLRNGNRPSSVGKGPVSRPPSFRSTHSSRVFLPNSVGIRPVNGIPSA